MVRGAEPEWVPDAEILEQANVTRFAESRGFSDYHSLWSWSTRDRVGFWNAVVERLGVVFETPYVQTLDVLTGFEDARWFLGGRLNIVESCFGSSPDDAIAVVHRRGEELNRVTYGELQRSVEVAARGFSKDESVAIAMPMSIEAVIAYLAVVYAGGRVISIADSFAAPQIAARLNIAPVTTVVTQDVIVRGGRRFPMVEKVWEATRARCVVVRSDTGSNLALREHDVEWDEFFSRCDARPSKGPHVGVPERQSNVLFSSGTTGSPKAIPWTHSTPIKAAMDAHFHQDVHPGDVVCWPTNLGWMMGPWLIYGSLINGAAMALFDDAPSGRAFGRFVREAEVTMLGVVPSLVNSWRASECMSGLDWSRIRLFSSTGEVSRADDMRYLSKLAGGKPVIEYCGGTEIGGGYMTSTVTHPWRPSTFTTPTLGIDVTILDQAGEPSDDGELYLAPPSVGMSTEILNADHHKVYYADTPRAGLRRHGDRFAKVAEGYRALGRNDDAMNLGGIKVSSAEIEAIARTVTGVADAAAVGVPVSGGGQDRLVVFVVPTEGTAVKSGPLREGIQAALKQQLNPLFKVYWVELVSELPRTASGKVIRRKLRAQFS